MDNSKNTEQQQGRVQELRYSEFLYAGLDEKIKQSIREMNITGSVAIQGWKKRKWYNPLRYLIGERYIKVIPASKLYKSR